MSALSWKLAGCLVVFQALQAIVAVAFLALLLWLDKRARTRCIRTAGDMA